MRSAIMLIGSLVLSSAAMAQVGGAATGGGVAGAGAGGAAAATNAPRPGTVNNILTNNSPFNTNVSNATSVNSQLFRSQNQALNTFNNAFTNTPGGANFGFAGQPGAANPFTTPNTAQGGAIPLRAPQSTITTFTAPARTFDFHTNDTTFNPWISNSNPVFNSNEQVK